MDYKQLIADLTDIYENYISELCGNDKLNCADLCIGKGEDCVIVQAISAIETLTKERDQFIEALHGNCDECVNKYESIEEPPCFSCRYGMFQIPPIVDNWKWKGLEKNKMRGNLCKK